MIKQYKIFLIKANEDLTAALKFLNDKEISVSIVFFHLQQAVEKFLNELTIGNAEDVKAYIEPVVGLKEYTEKTLNKAES
jgi:HEPN domain-containing protein